MRGPISAPGIENLPVNEELIKDKKVKTIDSILASPNRMGRPYIAPPRTPEKVMTILREAFKKVTLDPQAREEAKNKMELEYTTAPEVIKIINQILNQPPDIVKEFGKYIKF